MIDTLEDRKVPTLETAELSVRQRGILATGVSATYLAEFSKPERLPISGRYGPPVLVPRRREYYSRGKECVLQWQDFGGPLPPWFDPVMQGLVDLLTLPPDWDSYGARSVDPALVQLAVDFVNTFMKPSSPAPRVVPLSSGGLQLEWHRKGIDLEVVFDHGQQPFFHQHNRSTGEESEHVLPENSLLLRSIISGFE